MQEAGRVTFFQSPLHRGRLWNSPRDTYCFPSMSTFSPLFIGEGSGTSLVPFFYQQKDCFQSPLHWGGISKHWLFRYAITFQITFSPLFIGEGSGMPTYELEDYVLRLLQSPLH